MSVNKGFLLLLMIGEIFVLVIHQKRKGFLKSVQAETPIEVTNAQVEPVGN